MFQVKIHGLSALPWYTGLPSKSLQEIGSSPVKVDHILAWGEGNEVEPAATKSTVPSQIMIVHLRGNDLVSTSLRMLIQKIKKDLSKIKQLMPTTCILWSDIVARIQYRGAQSNAKTENARKSLNSMVHPHISKLDGL